MKIFTKIASIIVTLSLLLSTLVFSVSAAKNAVIYFSKSTVEVGDKVTVSVTVNPDKEMYAVGFYLEYNDEVLKYDSGSGTGDAGVLKVVESPSGDKSVKYSFTFTAIKVGSSSVTVKDCNYDVQGKDGMAENKSFGGASAKMTVKDPDLSSNAKLKSIKVSGHSLSPKFSPSKTSYTVKVPNDVTKVNITATPSDDGAKVVSVTGNTNLKVGVNTVTITVEAENGTQKKYTVKVTRLKEEEEEETTSEQEETEETDEDTSLQTTVAGSTYSIITELPKDILFDGFTVETTKVNGYEVQTAVDKEGIYRIFYLQAADSEDLTPYLYDEQLDEFEKLQYIIINNRTYIFSQIPEDMPVPATMYDSTVNINDFSVDCLSDTDAELSDFHYVYCFVDGVYNLYRYDALEGTLQRHPDFEVVNTVTDNKSNNFSTRFSSLSTNSKIIFIALIILVLGVLALLVLLIVYFIRRSYVEDDDVILSMYDMGFDEVEVNSDSQD